MDIGGSINEDVKWAGGWINNECEVERVTDSEVLRRYMIKPEGWTGQPGSDVRWTGEDDTEARAGSTRTRRDQRETPEKEPPARGKERPESGAAQKLGRENVAQRSQLR